MKASRESVAYRLDAASSPNQLDTSRFEAPERKKPTQTERREPVGRQPASKQGTQNQKGGPYPAAYPTGDAGAPVLRHFRCGGMCLPDLFANAADGRDPQAFVL